MSSQNVKDSRDRAALSAIIKHKEAESESLRLELARKNETLEKLREVATRHFGKQSRTMSLQAVVESLADWPMTKPPGWKEGGLIRSLRKRAAAWEEDNKELRTINDKLRENLRQMEDGPDAKSRWAIEMKNLRAEVVRLDTENRNLREETNDLHEQVADLEDPERIARRIMHKTAIKASDLILSMVRKLEGE